MRRAGPRPHLHLYLPLGGEGNHVVKNVGVGGLLHQSAKVHHLVVTGGSSVCVCDSQPEPTEKPPMAASRSLATALWRARFASDLLPQSYNTTRDTTTAVS